jgi:SAM-dependent methyltransferase
MADLIALAYERHLPLNARGALLDLGCEKVPLYASYQRLISESVCVDWANTLHKNQYLDHECDLTQPLPFPDGRFDTVILSDVLEHIPTPEDLCCEIARILNTGGKLLMNVPFYYWLHEEPHDYYRYTQYALRRFMGHAGLTVVTLDTIGGSPEVLADVLAKHLACVPLVGKPLAVLVQWATLSLVRSSLGQKVSRWTSRKFPFGYFLVAVKD